MNADGVNTCGRALVIYTVHTGNHLTSWLFVLRDLGRLWQDVAAEAVPKPELADRYGALVGDKLNARALLLRVEDHH
ncbi:MAG: hypothetical protein KC503_01425 [Myxococcales bacterium]|nr:hypothetical protein [Myxococcales bacterium]